MHPAYINFLASYFMLDEQEAHMNSRDIGLQNMRLRILEGVYTELSGGSFETIPSEAQRAFFVATIEQLARIDKMKGIQAPIVHEFDIRLHDDLHEEGLFQKTLKKHEDSLYFLYTPVRKTIRELCDLPSDEREPVNKYTSYLFSMEKMEETPQRRTQFLQGFTEELRLINQCESPDFDWRIDMDEDDLSHETKMERRENFFYTALAQAALIKDRRVAIELCDQIIEYCGATEAPSQYAAHLVERLWEHVENKDRPALQTYKENAGLVVALEHRTLVAAQGEEAVQRQALHAMRFLSYEDIKDETLPRRDDLLTKISPN